MIAYVVSRTSILARCRCALLASIIVCGYPFTLSAAGGTDDISSLFYQFRSLSSLSFSSDVEMTITEQVPAQCICSGPTGIVAGNFDYWASGTKYRCNSNLDPAAYAGMQTQVAYNGIRSQLLLANGTLAHSSQDWPTLLPILQNPLLELVQFRYPLSDANSHLELRLRDVLVDSVPNAFFNVTWVPVNENGVQLVRATFPGATYEGSTYVYHVFAIPNRTDQPVRIDRVTSTGRITSTEFTDYVRYDTLSQKAYWPLTVKLRAFDPTGLEMVRIEFELNDLAVDESLDNSVFTIDALTAQRVWNDDAELFEPLNP